MTDQKLKFWNTHPSWEAAEKAWDKKAEELQSTHPLKQIRHLPSMPGVTKKTARFLKWKSLYYLLTNDKNRIFLRYFFKKPLKYSFRLLKSYLKKKSYTRDDDFFFYSIQNLGEFKILLEHPASLLVLGFSYCHKPHECPSKRFSNECSHQVDHPVCRQCFIGKTLHALPEKEVIPVIIPTVHYIGERLFEIIEANPQKRVFFLITACELTLKMFGDWGNMLGVSGIGVRLDGRICNTMEAFILSEEGIKPGLTVVLDHSQKRILDLLKHPSFERTH